MCLSGTYIKTNDIIRIFIATYRNCTNSNETLQSWKKIKAKRQETSMSLTLTPQVMHNQFKISSARTVMELYV